MEEREIRLRLIEAAARNPVPHKDGFVAGVLEAAQRWESYVAATPEKIPGKGTLTLPKKAN